MSTNPLSNQNYINKDFQSIYPELLELVKQLSYKWDPTISNESDPGVVLIKLNAILADKNNYIIDKNLLECFPDTVTQDSNAYQLFNQLGYKMGGYVSATGEASFLWNSDTVKDENGNVYVVPLKKFTMLSDRDKSIVYTLLEDVSLSMDKYGTEVRGKVIQGVVRDYTSYGDKVIRIDSVDNRNRLYFPMRNVAENGIFIGTWQPNLNNEMEFVYLEDTDSTITQVQDARVWKLVENLQSQPMGTKCYTVGLDNLTNSFYVEFPSDYASLFGDGISIKYIQTDGYQGNIRPGVLRTFYTDYEIMIPGVSDEPETLNITKLVDITNVNSMLTGKDPETIDDAYANYKRAVGTFDTLVTLRDYLNYIINPDFGVASNGVVSDRTTDIQSSYKIMKRKEWQDSNLNHFDNVLDTKVLKDGDGNEHMSAFDLKTYLLSFSPVDSVAKFSTSEVSEIKRAYEKSFTLDLNTSDGEDKLSTSQKVLELIDSAKSVQHNFISKLTSIYANSDANNISQIYPLFIKNKVNLTMSIVPTSYVTSAQAAEIEKNIYTALYTGLSADKLRFGEELLYETIYDICNAADSRVKAVALEPLEFIPYAVVYIKYEDSNYEDGRFTNGELREIELPTTVISNSDYPYLVNTLNPHSLDDYVDNDKDVAKIIATDILAKSVLSGSTALYVPSLGFKYDLFMTNAHLYREVKSVSTHMELEFSDGAKMLHSGEGEEITLGENESITLYAPELTGGTSYSSGTKYLYYTRDTYTGTNSLIPPNVDYELQTGQVLFLFLKEEDSSTAPYKYYKYTKGAIINSSIQLVDEKSTKSPLIQKLESLGLGAEGQIVGSTNDAISDIMDTILSTTKTIVVKDINDVELKTATKYFSWITSEYGEDERNNIDYDSSKITFSRRKEYGPIVKKSYSDGYLYLANFSYNAGQNGKDALHSHTLAEDQKILILEPQEETITYNVWDEYTESVKPNSALVTGYKKVGLLESGCEIRSTGTLWNCSNADSFQANPYRLEPRNCWHIHPDSVGKETLTVTNDSTIISEIEIAGSNTRKWVEKDVVVAPSKPLHIEFHIDFDPGSGVEAQFDVPLTWYRDDGTLIKDETIFTLWDDYDDGDYSIGCTAPEDASKLRISFGSTNYHGRVTLSGFTLYADDSKTTEYSISMWDMLSQKENIPWGRLSTDINYSGVAIHSPEVSSTAELLNDFRSILSLSNGFRIDVLSSAPDTQTIFYYDYIVKNNENFFYANSNRDAIEVLGVGSRVTLKLHYPNGVSADGMPPSITSIVKRIPLTETVLPKDTSYWKDKGIIASNLPVIGDTSPIVSYFVNSSNLITLGEGTKIKVRRLGEEVQVGQPVIVGQTNSTVVSYVVEDPLYKSLKITSDGIYTSSDENSIGGTIEWSELNPTALSHFVIQYRNADDENSSFVELPRAQQSSIAWNGWATLNIKALTDIPQALDYEHKHSVDVTYLLPNGSNSSSYISETVSLESNSNESSDIKYLKFSPGLDLMGGTNISLAAVGFDNQLHYPSLLTYTRRSLEGVQDADDHQKCSLVVCESENKVVCDAVSHLVDSSGTNFVKINLTDKNITSVKFHLSNIVEDSKDSPTPSDLYIVVPFRFVDTSPSSDTGVRAPTLWKLTGSSMLQDSSESYILGVPPATAPAYPMVSRNTYYYLKLPLGSELDTTQCIYSALGDNSSGDYSEIPEYLYIYEPYFVDYNLSSLVSEKDLLDKISLLDIDKEFDYAYKPDSSISLDNPLLGKRYFRSNHIFNKFTIPQLSNINLTTMNKR